MFFGRAVRMLLTAVILIQCQILVMTVAYSQVSSSGSGNGEGPKIYKALNLDLIFPKSFNSSENVISTTPAVPVPSVLGGSAITDVVVDGGRQQQQYNPLPQSNEQTNRDAVGDDTADDGDKQPLYVTPSPNEAALYGAHGADMDSSRNRNGINNGNDAQVVTENPINIQQQQPQRQQQQQQLNDKNNNYDAAMEQQNIATGRAVDYHTGYPFGQLITPLIKNAPRPVYSNSQAKPVTAPRPPSSSSSSAANVGKIAVYPQAVYQQRPPSQAEIDKFRGKGVFRDRFTPSEAVASHQLKSAHHNHNQHHHNHAPTYTAAGKIPASSNVVNSYVPPKNLYSFPPNNANYPFPGQDSKLGLPSNNVVNSYSPPPSGPLKDATYPLTAASSNDNGYKYAGPLSLGYLPTINNNNDNGDTKDQMENSDGNGDSDSDGDGNGTDADNGDINDSIGVLPASALDGNDNSNDMDPMVSMDMKDEHSHDDPHDDHSYDTEKEYPTPPPEWLKAHPEAAQEHPPHDHDHNEHHHDHSEHHHDDPQPEIEFDHDHDHHHHHPDIILDHDSHSYPYHHSIPSFPVYHHYPEIIYDDHHDHHHVEPPPPITTEAPLPEPPPEPRVKKYSYFYIGRKLWYIPLYFTVWFSFYVLWLILKSIARHKVNLPNHYVARRSVDNYNLSKRQQEIINQLTVSVLDKIDNFKRLNVN